MLTAYLDPGAGSVIATFIVGGIASLGVLMRSLRARVTGVFSRGKPDGSDSVAADAVDVES